MGGTGMGVRLDLSWRFISMSTLGSIQTLHEACELQDTYPSDNAGDVSPIYTLPLEPIATSNLAIY